jgi:hypothetical protein
MLGDFSNRAARSSNSVQSTAKPTVGTAWQTLPDLPVLRANNLQGVGQLPGQAKRSNCGSSLFLTILSATASHELRSIESRLLFDVELANGRHRFCDALQRAALPTTGIHIGGLTALLRAGSKGREE